MRNDLGSYFEPARGLRRLWLIIRVLAVALWRTVRSDAPKYIVLLRLTLLLALRRLRQFGIAKRHLLKAAAFSLAGILLLCGAYALGVSAQSKPEAAAAITILPGGIPQNADSDIQGLTLRFDDRWIVSPGTDVLSLGDNKPENPIDDEILRLDDGIITAVGTGTTNVTLSDKKIRVTVIPAPISLLLLIGQSNMEGNEGDPACSIACPPGEVYSSYGPSSVKLAKVIGGNSSIPLLTKDSSALLVPLSLSGTESRIGRAGTALLYPLNALTAGGGGKAGPDSGIAWGWIAAMGEKIWTVNAAHSGSSILTWLPGAENFCEAEAMYRAAEETLSKEIAAGHYTLSHMGYFWLQGCADNGMSSSEYKECFLAMHRGLKAALRCELGPIEFAGILMVQAADGTENFTTWRELAMNGPRTAQYEMGADFSGDCSDIFVVSTIMENWVYDDKGENTGVFDYFSNKYGEYITYPVQDGRTNWPIPKMPEDVKDSIHYNQVGYNEIGIDAAENMARILTLLSKK